MKTLSELVRKGFASPEVDTILIVKDRGLLGQPRISVMDQRAEIAAVVESDGTLAVFKDRFGALTDRTFRIDEACPVCYCNSPGEHIK